LGNQNPLKLKTGRFFVPIPVPFLVSVISISSLCLAAAQTAIKAIIEIDKQWR
jgi:hypothetical protein